MRLSFSTATQADAPALVALGTAVAEDLARRYGRGPWTSMPEKREPLSMRDSRIVTGRKGKSIVGMLRLSTKKPWAPDVPYFTSVKKALYLTDVAVVPTLQRQGIGRMLLEEAVKQARAWPADAIRLDAFNADAGAVAFYAKCGFREVARAKYLRVPFILSLVYFELVL
jgi:ribosomal protein S18 acetylase RimI-like enzyme